MDLCWASAYDWATPIYPVQVPGLDEGKMEESHMISAAAFVEGGIQEACDDTCSICLEAFCDSEPSTVTSCKHEFHLQCILECLLSSMTLFPSLGAEHFLCCVWRKEDEKETYIFICINRCQRSSNCPMCWQPISLKDPDSQELLDAIEQERSFRLTPSRNATTFHHPTFGDFEFQHLPMGVNDPELQDRIIQHLAAAAAMGRTHRIARREGSRSRSSAHARPQFVLFSANPNESSLGPNSASLAPGVAESELATATVPNEFLQSNQISASSSTSLAMPTSRQGISHDNRSYESQSSLPNQDREGPSDFQPFSDNWKSRLNAMSMKYKESISRSTRGWKEKLFSRSSSMADIGTEVRREVNAGIATVSRMMERLETRDNDRGGHVPSNNVDSSVNERSNHENRDTPNETPSNGNNSASFAANPISS
ncbi:hypothetical protein RD792_011779 [Penstemon davidsonii]|uniref:RING-type E3 ubiquitin transferase n=1 Tax=Penstemon davidsonii TaxID=160366 RepID=A0ABR0CWQ3_9LAMI|nr:hypothetical protein RD792_011779 [Penstemon davidsonii]